MEKHFPHDSTIIDSIYTDETMHPYADFSELDYYDISDMGYKQADTVTPLSPALSDGELGNWKLNEVFQDLIGMEGAMDTTADVSTHDEVSLDVGDLLKHQDLLSEAFDLESIDNQPPHPATPADDVFTDSQLVPLPVLDCTSTDVSAATCSSAVVKVGNKKKEAIHKVSNKGKPKVRKAKTSSKSSAIDTQTITVKPHETPKEAIRRVKNNVASKVFRSRKKSKLEGLENEEERLNADNRQLRADLEMVEGVVRVLKERLIHSTRVSLNN